MKKRSLWRAFALVVVALTLLAVFSLRSRRAPILEVRPAEDAETPADAREEPKPRRSPPKRPRARPERPDAQCAPGAFQRCHEGDVWSEDSCGQLEAPIEDCGVQLCREGACELPDPEPCEEPSEGRCEGEVVHLCYAGRAERIDCAAQGMRCVQGEEGAECAPEIPRAERCRGASRCDGDVLVRCVQGRVERVDCTLTGATCSVLGQSAPACVQLLPALPTAACGPCGCPPLASGEARCDGFDEDGDALLDEGLACGPLPVVAFVVVDAAGNGSYARDEIAGEVAHANQLLAGDDEHPGLSLELADVFELSEPSWLNLDEDTFQKLVDDPRLHPKRDRFYLPVLFTDRLEAEGGVPRVGASTLPNGTCGGMRRGHGPKVGLIAIAKGRASTTFSHELGHFLGLCHTHERGDGTRRAALEGAALSLCEPSCTYEGDGVCDTPLDPGPGACAYDATCSVRCDRGEQPDVHNLMSYYTACRNAFTPDQWRIVQHTLALRRGVHPCLTAACDCDLGAMGCPAGMGCRPARGAADHAATCQLAGARPPGAPCESHRDCDAQSLCLTSDASAARCVRGCRGTTPGCECIATALGFSVCREDIAR